VDLPQETRHQQKSTASELWESTLAATSFLREPIATGKDNAAVDLPAGKALSDWLDLLTGSSLVESINDQMIKWSGAFLDEGMANWEMPSRQGGFYQAWRDIAQHDRSVRFLGIKHSGRKIRELPTSAEDSIASSLKRLGIPKTRWTQYLSRLITHLPGWTGFIRWRGENPDYDAQQHHPIDPVQYLAVRLFYEVELVDVVAGRQWGVQGTLPAIVSHCQTLTKNSKQLSGNNAESHDGDSQAICSDAWRLFHLAQFLAFGCDDVASLSQIDIQTLLRWLDAFSSDRHGSVWLAALESTYRDRLVEKLSQSHAANTKSISTSPNSTPRGQLVFCIDVRSEPMRRQIEARGPYQTFGFAGFFGIPISYQAFDSDDHAALCPVILAPKFAVNEVARSDENESLQTYAASSRWNMLGDHLFHDLKHNAVSSLMLIDVVGLLFGGLLAGKTFFRSGYDSMNDRVSGWFSRDVATLVPVELETPRNENAGDSLPQGFTLDQQVAFVEGALRAIGLTQNFGRFVVLCGHGSTSDNNPYAAAYNCGACGGGHGDANARVFARMANNPEVRQRLRDNGLNVSDETWFLAAKHNTVTDTITFYDKTDVPSSHTDDLRLMIDDMEQASDLQTSLRIDRLPQAPQGLSPKEAREHMMSRSIDWANVRPEWGLSGNAAIIIGRRSLTDSVDLDGRVFLQSYDADSDDQAGILEALMTAPLVVAQWISMEYYFSAVDPVRYGSGSKVTHNIVSGIGVMHGAHGDLQTGLPLQSVNDGDIHYHQPVRLLAVIEAPTDRIDTVVNKHELLQHLLHNQWIHLVAVDPANGLFQRYSPSGSWEALS
ncbi:MAG: DUF2309 domain-containing protein, partial [Pirellulaceae bacterium]